MSFNISAFKPNSFHLKVPKLKTFSLSNKNFGASTFMPNLFRVDKPIKDPKPKIPHEPVSIQGNPLYTRKRFPGMGAMNKASHSGFK